MRASGRGLSLVRLESARSSHSAGQETVKKRPIANRENKVPQKAKYVRGQKLKDFPA